jgi:hypothetical protein
MRGGTLPVSVARRNDACTRKLEDMSGLYYFRRCLYVCDAASTCLRSRELLLPGECIIRRLTGISCILQQLCSFCNLSMGVLIED